MTPGREQPGPWTQRFPIEALTLDVGLVLLGLNQAWLDAWVAEHALAVYAAMGLLQVVALGCAFWGLGTWLKGFPEHGLWRRVAGAYGLVLVLAVGGFSWLGLPALVMDTDAAWRVFSLQAFVVVFGSVLALGVLGERASEWPPPFHQRALTAVGIFIYLTVARSLLLFVARSNAVPWGVVLAATGLSYLPVRLILVLRPPWSLIEVATALGAYGMLMAALL